MNTTEDWSLILDICERVTRQTNGSKDCLKSIMKRLNHKVPFVSMQALTLLEACVNNCGRNFHLEICSSYFVSECRSLISQKAHPKVASRLKVMIKGWAEMPEFRDDPALNLIPSFYESLKKEGCEFSDGEVKKTSSTADVSQAKKEEDDIAKAIALSLQESDQTKTSKAGSSSSTSSTGGASSLYPTYATPASSQSINKSTVKVRALYDFEAAEDNELTFKAGELICVLDDSDPNWWKGSNHRGEGLFPANFVTADLTVEPEPEVKAEKKSVQFNEAVEVRTLSPGQEEIDEATIDEVLTLIQNADPTGEAQPDSHQMLVLEEQCKAMGPLIDAELEKVDRKHATLVELNKKVMDALQMYHSLMKDTPTYGYAGIKPAGPVYTGGLPQGPAAGTTTPGLGQSAQMYSGQPQYLMTGGMVPQQLGPGPTTASHSFSQTQQPSASSHQSFPSHTSPVAMSSYSAPMAETPVLNMPATNGSQAPVSFPHQQYAANYSQELPSNMSGMYHPPAPQQPLL